MKAVKKKKALVKKLMLREKTVMIVLNKMLSLRWLAMGGEFLVSPNG